ncbi:DNA polymerase zeta [Dispira simplex]|nr:DNA polymerase zeta [Dispira simplex]
MGHLTVPPGTIATDPILSVRLCHIDHYISDPLPPCDSPRVPGETELKGTPRQVPVLRVFGRALSTNQTVCLHVHRVWPYFYIECTHSLASAAAYKETLISGLNRALAHALQAGVKGPTCPQYIAGVALVRGIPFYGYHARYHYYWKIYYTDPDHGHLLAAMLRRGAILGTQFDVYESNVSYILQFLTDYNLYGMDWIHLSHAVQRWSLANPRDLSAEIATPVNHGLASTLATPARLPCPTGKIDKMSYCAQEIDALGEWILNRHRSTHRVSCAPTPSVASAVPWIESLENVKRMLRGLDCKLAREWGAAPEKHQADANPENPLKSDKVQQNLPSDPRPFQWSNSDYLKQRLQSIIPSSVPLYLAVSKALDEFSNLCIPTAQSTEPISKEAITNQMLPALRQAYEPTNHSGIHWADDLARGVTQPSSSYPTAFEALHKPFPSERQSFEKEAILSAPPLPELVMGEANSSRLCPSIPAVVRTQLSPRLTPEAEHHLTLNWLLSTVHPSVHIPASPTVLTNAPSSEVNLVDLETDENDTTCYSFDGAYNDQEAPYDDNVWETLHDIGQDEGIDLSYVDITEEATSQRSDQAMGCATQVLPGAKWSNLGPLVSLSRVQPIIPQLDGSHDVPEKPNDLKKPDEDLYNFSPDSGKRRAFFRSLKFAPSPVRHSPTRGTSVRGKHVIYPKLGITRKRAGRVLSSGGSPSTFSTGDSRYLAIPLQLNYNKPVNTATPSSETAPSGFRSAPTGRTNTAPGSRQTPGTSNCKRMGILHFINASSKKPCKSANQARATRMARRIRGETPERSIQDTGTLMPQTGISSLLSGRNSPEINRNERVQVNRRHITPIVEPDTDDPAACVVEKLDYSKATRSPCPCPPTRLVLSKSIVAVTPPSQTSTLSESCSPPNSPDLWVTPPFYHDQEDKDVTVEKLHTSPSFCSLERDFGNEETPLGSPDNPTYPPSSPFRGGSLSTPHRQVPSAFPVDTPLRMLFHTPIRSLPHGFASQHFSTHVRNLSSSPSVHPWSGTQQNEQNISASLASPSTSFRCTAPLVPSSLTPRASHVDDVPGVGETPLTQSSSSSTISKSHNLTELRLMSSKSSSSNNLAHTWYAHTSYLQYAVPPPSTTQLIASLKAYALPHIVYPEPFDPDTTTQGTGSTAPGAKTRLRLLPHTTSQYWTLAQKPPTSSAVSRWLSEQRTLSLNVGAGDPLAPRKEDTFNRSKGYTSLTSTLSSSTCSSSITLMSILAMELHVNTREDFWPDPTQDEISYVFCQLWSPADRSQGLATSTPTTAEDFSTPPQYLVMCNVTTFPDKHIGHIRLPSTPERLGQHLRQIIQKMDGHPHATVEFRPHSTEAALIHALVEQVTQVWDPDAVTGFELHSGSWGYLFDRVRHQYKVDLAARLGRVRLADLPRTGTSVLGDELRNLREETPEESNSHVEDLVAVWGQQKSTHLHIPGRHVLNVWRLLRKSSALQHYSRAHLVHHFLGQRIPSFSHATLTRWLMRGDHRQQLRAYQYYLEWVWHDTQLLERSNLIHQTSEFAKLYGIDFFSVLTRGSQYRVESALLRLTKPLNFILLSPGRDQVVRQPALECIPMVMEPRAAFYVDPVVVLDFQSLYPSIIIAYNYCYSTCLGPLVADSVRKLGVTQIGVPPEVLAALIGHRLVQVAPNARMYVKSTLRKSTLARMLMELLDTRCMVKERMKKVRTAIQHHRKANLDNRFDVVLRIMERTLHQLDDYQLALKLLANVVYGYAGASFSGRMPCSDLADSIVQTGRQTLERAIATINNHPTWDAQVVYGDTDSVFVQLRGITRARAFELGQEMANVITQQNPAPVKLKMEKVYHPCVLLTKKRYVGFKYESPEQTHPEYEGKGIETVRRDNCSLVQKVMKQCLTLLFTDPNLAIVRQYLYHEWDRVLQNRWPLRDFIFAKEVRLSKYKITGLPPPGAIVALKQMAKDPRREPLYGERVPYVVVYGGPNDRLADQVVSPYECASKPYLRPHGKYYIVKQIIPCLNRIFTLLGVDLHRWYATMPKRRGVSLLDSGMVGLDLAKPGEQAGGSKGDLNPTLERFFTKNHCIICHETLQQPRTSEGQHLCVQCVRDPQRTTLALTNVVRNVERKYHALRWLCSQCTGAPIDQLTSLTDKETGGFLCHALDCAVYHEQIAMRTSLRIAEKLGIFLQQLKLNGRQDLF